METRTTNPPGYSSILTDLIPRYWTELADLMRTERLPTDSCPAAPVPGESDFTFVCKGYAYGASKISAATGFPEISVNAGTAASNAQVGMFFLGAKGADISGLRLGAPFEKINRSKQANSGVSFQ